MFRKRVIPCLLLSEGGFVKTKKFRDPVYVGDPINIIKIFNDKEVDELIILDIDRSKKKTPPDFVLLEKIAGECFIPLCYGGGIASIDDASRVLSLGVEKISMQTNILDDFRLIESLAKRFGSQSIVASVDVRKSLFGKYKLYSSARKKSLGVDVLEFINDAISAGAGEIFINFVDRDGMMGGMEINYISQLCSKVSTPVIVCGGVGSNQDIKDALDNGADAVAVGSFFIFNGKFNAVLISYPTRRNLRELTS